MYQFAYPKVFYISQKFAVPKVFYLTKMLDNILRTTQIVAHGNICSVYNRNYEVV